MAFTPTTWVDGTTAITATELNRIETGIEDAHAALPYAGKVTGTTGVLGISGPTGWTVSRISAGYHRVTHNLGTTDYAVVLTLTLPGTTSVLTLVNPGVLDADYFDAHTRVDTGSGLVMSDLDFTFVLVPFV